MTLAATKPVAGEPFDHRAQSGCRDMGIKVGTRESVGLQMPDRRRDALSVRLTESGEHGTDGFSTVSLVANQV